MRYKIVTCRFTAEEHAAISSQSKESGLSISDLFRDTARGIKLEQRPPKIHAETLRELSKWGNNLNQLARKANSSGIDDQFMDELREIDAALQEIKHRVLQ